MKNLKLRKVITTVFMHSEFKLYNPSTAAFRKSFGETGSSTIINGTDQRLYNYHHLCYKEADRLHFSSDKKMTLRWYDERCSI